MTATETLPCPTQPWQAAKERFLGGLSAEEVRRFEAATPENLFQEANAAQKSHAQGSKSWIMQERLASLVEGINDYGKALDVYVNTYGIVLSPLWGSLRVVLHIASEAGKFQEKIVDMLAQIGDALPRFRIYQALFAGHERILIALTEAYLDVLRFCIRTKDFFLKSRRSLIPLSVILKGSWKPFRQDFERDIDVFRKHTKLIEKEASLAHMIETAKVREIEAAQRAVQIQNNKVKRRHKILSALRVADYQGTHARLSRLRHPGTNTWIQNNSDYVSWHSSPTSTCLPCYGIPGSGKSILAASVASELANTRDPSTILCYFYCDYAEAVSLDPVYIISSLVKQVLVHLPLDYFSDTFSCPYQEDKPAPSLAEGREFFCRLLSHFKVAFIVIDGVDELSQADQRVVLDLTQQLLQLATPVTKILITSRSEEYLIKNAFSAYNSIHLSDSPVQCDIIKFIDDTIKDTISKHNPALANEDLKQEVSTTLAASAHGMFLWVKFQLFDIAEALTEHDVRMTLSNLPKDLSETYRRIIEKIQAGPGGEPKIKLMRNIFRWIACARRPLSIDELEEAVGLDKDDKRLHIERIATNAGQRLISSCGNLVVYNMHDHTVTFAHHTIQQYLCTPMDSTMIPTTRTVRFDLDSADAEIGQICIAYLSFSDFETQVSKAPVKAVLKGEEAERLVWGEVPFAGYIKGLISWTNTWQGPPEETSLREVSFPLPTSNGPENMLQRKYALLEYVITFWTSHTSSFTADIPCWASFERVALHRQLMFEFRPWTDPQYRARVDKVLKDWKLSDNSQEWNHARGSPRDSNTPESLYMYSWSVSNGIGSLLTLVEGNSLFTYFTEMYPQLLGAVNPYRAFIFFLGLTFIRFKNKAWTGATIRYFIELLQGGAPDLNPETIESLHLLRAELYLWADINSYTMSPMFEEAMDLSLQCDDERMFGWLVSYYVRNSQQPARALILMVKTGRANTKTLKTLLCHEGRRKYASTFSLSLTLWKLLPIVSTMVQEDSRATDAIHPHLASLLLILALSSDRYLDLAERLIQRSPLLRFYELNFEDKSWHDPDLGSSDDFAHVRKLRGHDALAVAFQTARALSEKITVPFKHISYAQVLASLMSRYGFRFPTKIYESRGINCLNWALEWEIETILECLIVHYQHLVEDPECHEIARVILERAIQGGEKHLAKVLELPWPESIITQVLDSHAMTELESGYRSRLQYLFKLYARLRAVNGNLSNSAFNTNLLIQNLLQGNRDS